MKTILITGGSDGLGKAIAKLLAKENNLIILASNKEKLEASAKEIGCELEVCDVGSWDSVSTAVENIEKRHSRIDCLINNAGLWIQGLLEENDPKRISEVFNVNSVGPILMSRAVVPLMKKQGSGQIINVISQAGIYWKAERSVYNASKWAVTGFTKCLQLELAPFNIRVSGFYPGYMRTDLFSKGGNEKLNWTGAMDVDEVAKIVEFVVNSPNSMLIPEIGLKDIQNQV